MLSRSFIAAFAVLCALASPAIAQKTKAQLTTEIGTTYPDNTVGAITPAGVRAYETDVLNSIMPTAPVVNGDVAVFDGTTGLLKDGGAPISGLSGDCTATSLGVITCTKTNGVPFSGLATAVAGTGLLLSGTTLNLNASFANITGTASIAQLPGGASIAYDTVAAATAATIPSTAATIYLRGAYAAGDRGGGFWVRSASNPGHTAFFNSADGAFWSPSMANGTFPIEMFGGKCDSGVTDNTPALAKAVSFAHAVGAIYTTWGSCFYYGFTTAPAAITNGVVHLLGAGPGATTLGMSVNGDFINYTGVNAVTVRDMQICSISPKTTGNLLSFVATSSLGSNENHLDNLTVGDCTGTHDYSLVWDGQAKTTGAVGVRDQFVSNIFAKKAFIRDVVGMSWSGGSVINGSSNSFDIFGPAPFQPSSIRIQLATTSGIGFNSVHDAIVYSNSFAGNIVFDVGTDFAWVIGRTNTVTVTNNCGTPADCGAFNH